MKLSMLVLPAVALAVMLPARANAGTFSGIVVAEQPQRGALLLATAHGVGLTVRGGVARSAVGERVAITGVRLPDGTVRASGLHVQAGVRTTTLRATVLRRVGGGMLLASGRSVVMVHRSSRRLASAADDGRLRVGEVADFRIRFDDDELVEAAPPLPVGQAATARIEGTILSLAPFVISTEGLPLTIAVPAGVTLPAGLAAGQQIELTVHVGSGNVFTLVAIDEIESENADVQGQEVEVDGLVVGSTATQLVLSVNGTMLTFAPRAGATLPVLPLGAHVEARGVRTNGSITLERLRAEDNTEDGDGDSGGHGGGDDGGGGH